MYTADVRKVEGGEIAEETKNEMTQSINNVGISSAGSGYLWLLTSGDHIYKVDLSTESSVFDFSLTTSLYDYNGLEWDGSYLWVLGYNGFDDFYLEKYNQNGNFITRISLPAVHNGYDLGWSGSYFWVVDYNTSGHIFSKAYTSGNVIFAFNDPTPSSYDIAYGGGYIWGNSHTEDKIYKISTSGSITNQFSPAISSTSKGGLAYGDGYLWLVKYADGTIYKFTTAGSNVYSFLGPSSSIIAATYQQASCTCGSWQNGACGGDGCSSTQRHQTRTCTPSGCSSESRCVSDPSCGTITCYSDSDCGNSYWKNTPYCLDNDVYDYWVTPKCANPGTTSSYCYNQENAQQKQDCGDGYCDSWGSNYCENNDVYHSRTCYSKGCSGGSCYNNPYTDEQLVEDCNYGCENGVCLSCINGIKDGDEIGIDCGGSCPNQDCCTNGYKDTNLGEGGIDCDGNCHYSCVVPALLLHGYWSNPSKLSQLQTWLENDGYVVYNIDYAPNNPYSNGDIVKYAEVLRDEIKRIKKETGAEKVDIVVHSMGGLIARWYVNMMIGTDVRKLIMLGTPNHGSSRFKNAEYLWYVSIYLFGISSDVYEAVETFDEFVMGKARDQMQPCSEFINELNHLDPTICDGRESIWKPATETDYLSPATHHYVVGGITNSFGANKWGLGVGVNDGVVAIRSAYLDNANTNTYALGRDHSQLTNDAEVYNWIKEKLEEAVGLGSIQVHDNGLLGESNPSYYQELPEISGTIYAGENKSYTVPLYSVTNVEFSLGFLRGDVNFTLLMPNGSLINPEGCINNTHINYTQIGNLKSYIISQPSEGNWQLIVNAINVSINGSGFTLFTFLETDVMLESLFKKFNYEPNDIINLTISLNNSNGPIIDFNVSSKIKLPDSSVDILPLYDDGLHNDKTANDGIYGNVYDNTQSQGIYEITINASGNLDGRYYARVIKELVWVKNYPDLIAKNISFSNTAPIKGDNITINALVENIGENEALNATIEFYHSTKYEDDFIGEDNINVGVGETIMASVYWVNLTKGNYNITVLISPFNSFLESNYSNNRLKKSIFVYNLSERFILNDYKNLSLDFNSGGDKVAFVRLDGDNYLTKAQLDLQLYGMTWIANNSMFVGVIYLAYSTPVFADLDNDSDLDLVIGGIGGHLFYYENVGNLVNPVWGQNDSMFAGIGVGYLSAPTFADLDNDGDLDLTIGEYDGNLNYYENTGTSSSPIWVQNNSTFFGINVSHSTPTFADLDNDGDLDLTIGERHGTLYYYKNTGTSSSPIWVQNNSMFSGIDVGLYSAPTFADLDNDGDLDLTIGERHGTLYYYKNTGTSSSPIWVQNNSMFSGIDIGDNSAPTFADLDYDDDLDLIIGEFEGPLNYYKNHYVPKIDLDIINDDVIDYKNYNTSNTTVEFTDLLNIYEQIHQPEQNDYYIPLVFHPHSGGSVLIYNINISFSSPILFVNFNKGWNLLSIPLNLSNKSISLIFNSINYSAIFSFNNTNKQWLFYKNESFNNFDTIDETQAYWINSLTNQTLTTEGTEFAYPINFILTEGWNLISYPSLSNKLVNESLKDVNTTYDLMLTYKDNKWLSYSPNKPQYSNTLQNLTPWQGYWVKVPQNTTWTFDGVFR